jgi:hypothetical protein
MIRKMELPVEITSHELPLMEKMTSENKALMAKLSQTERGSFHKSVNLDKIDTVQPSIKSNEKIEIILFWDKGGRFDDPRGRN